MIKTNLVLTGNPECLRLDLSSDFLEVGEPSVQMQELGILRERWGRIGRSCSGDKNARQYPFETEGSSYVLTV